MAVKHLNLATFAYEVESPGRAHIYILDSGVDVGSSITYNKLVGFGRTPEWIFPGKYIPGGTQPFLYLDAVDARAYSDWVPDGHGTGVFSKAVGPDFGVSKAAGVTIVRLPELIRGPEDAALGPDFAGFRISTVIDGINRVWIDFLTRRANNPDFKCFMSMQLGLKATNVPPIEGVDEEYEVFTSMQGLANEGCVIVVSAGQDALTPGNPDGTTINSWPTIWGEHIPMVIVGGTDFGGYRDAAVQYIPSPKAPGAGVDVWNTDRFVVCDYKTGSSSESFQAYGGTVSRKSGTSFASPQIAGLAAYFASDPHFRQDIDNLVTNFGDPAQPVSSWITAVRTMLISKSYVRSPAQTERFGDPPDVSMAYNGAVPKNAQGQFVCPAVPAKLKRQAGDPPGLCVLPETPAQSSASLASVQSVASVVSASSLASFVSATSVQLTSISAIEASHISESSVASVSSVSAASVSSAAAAGATARTTWDPLSIQGSCYQSTDKGDDRNPSKSGDKGESHGVESVTKAPATSAIKNFCSSDHRWMLISDPVFSKEHTDTDTDSLNYATHIDVVPYVEPFSDCTNNTFPVIMFASDCQHQLAFFYDKFENADNNYKYGGKIVFTGSTGCIQWNLYQFQAVSPDAPKPGGGPPPATSTTDTPPPPPATTSAVPSPSKSSSFSWCKVPGDCPKDFCSDGSTPQCLLTDGTCVCSPLNHGIYVLYNHFTSSVNHGKDNTWEYEVYQGTPDPKQEGQGNEVVPCNSTPLYHEPGPAGDLDHPTNPSANRWPVKPFGLNSVFDNVLETTDGTLNCDEIMQIVCVPWPTVHGNHCTSDTPNPNGADYILTQDSVEVTKCEWV